MKEAELRRRANCSRCKKKIGESGSPVFAVVRQQDYIVNMAAVQRQTGLGLILGAGLAATMGPGEDMATATPEVVDLTLCALCLAQFEEWLDEA
ncbi:MAG TPA: hypothetical protein DCZ11_05345 [Gammaproteobacteria bacterium]|nr:hypothetical protein [Gammaproteobacteria bacterium]MCH77847.1 hypothetical protein [Gammaproteobacteria bacterium]